MSRMFPLKTFKMFTLNFKSRSIFFIYVCVLFSFSLIVLIPKIQLPVTRNSGCFLKGRNRRSCGLRTLQLEATYACTVLRTQESRFPLSSVRRGQILGRVSSPCLLDTVLSGMNHLMESLFSVQET